VYHPLKKITCPPLNKLNDLARLTLQFSLTQTLALPEDQILQRFIRYFEDNGYPKVGSWLWGKPILVRQYVLALINFPVDEKQDLFNVYLQNQAFDERFAAGAFIPVPIPPVTQIAYEQAAELARNFYKILCDGVPGENINEPEELNRQTVLRAYLDAQNQILLKVCPGCDGKPPSVSDGAIHEDLDHFFPKSKYPFLSIHPLNLTPLCKDCNQTYKSSKDAILDNNNSVADVHALNDIYHPYQCPARDDLMLEIKSNLDNDELAFTFVSRSNTTQSHARLLSLQYTLDLESRWTGDLMENRVEEQLHTLLMFGSQNDRGGNFQPDPNWLNQQLATALYTLNIKQGRQCNFVSALSYVKWVISSPQAQSMWLERVQMELTV